MKVDSISFGTKLERISLKILSLASRPPPSLASFCLNSTIGSSSSAHPRQLETTTGRRHTKPTLAILAAILRVDLLQGSVRNVILDYSDSRREGYHDGHMKCNVALSALLSARVFPSQVRE